MHIDLKIFETVDSTNTEALKMAREGAPEGTCVVARRQTAGRGRYGRTWVSEKDAGLYFSMVLRPRIELRFLPLITLMSGVAVHQTLSGYGIAPDIKWVNDVLVNERKISGILAETTETEAGVAVVVGIGINLTSLNFPPEIAATATSVQQAAGRIITPLEAAEGLVNELSHFYGVLCSPEGPQAIVDEWQRRSSYFEGKPVRVTAGGETITGVTAGLEPNGALRVRTVDGKLAIVQTGDVERLRAEAHRQP